MSKVQGGGGVDWSAFTSRVENAGRAIRESIAKSMRVASNLFHFGSSKGTAREVSREKFSSTGESSVGSVVSSSSAKVNSLEEGYESHLEALTAGAVGNMLTAFTEIYGDLSIYRNGQFHDSQKNTGDEIQNKGKEARNVLEQIKAEIDKLERKNEAQEQGEIASLRNLTSKAEEKLIASSSSWAPFPVGRGSALTLLKIEHS